MKAEEKLFFGNFFGVYAKVPCRRRPFAESGILACAEEYSCGSYQNEWRRATRPVISKEKQARL